jgi:hypothetical protein
MNFNWIPIIIGAVSAMIISVNLGFIVGSWGVLIGFLLAGMYVGYAVGGDQRNGAIQGALACFIAALVVGILPIVGIGGLVDAGGVAVELIALITTIILDSVMGAIGGIMGALIKNEG